MPGWLRRAAAWASRMTRSAFSPSTDLTATQRQRRSSQARWTVPWPPPPILSPIVNRPSTRSPSTTAIRFAAVRAPPARAATCGSRDARSARRGRPARGRGHTGGGERPVTRGLLRRGRPTRRSAPARRTARTGESRACRGARGPGGGHPHGGPPATKGQARARQAGLLLGAIVILILIVIAFRGCLDARKDRSYQNYVSDLSSITAETEQLSTNFFNRLEGKDEGSTGDIGFEGEVNGDKGTSQALLDRAEGLDAPDDIKGAQEQVVLSFELRHDALEGIAAQLSGLSAGGKEADKAGKAIYTQMKVLSASDILYARAQDQIEQALIDNDVTVDEGVPDSQFLPDDPNYLDPAVTAAALGGVSTSSGGTASDTACKNDGETHGLGLVDGSTLLQPTRHGAGQRRHRRPRSAATTRSRSPSRTRAPPTRATSTSTSPATTASTSPGRSTRSPPARRRR